MTWTPGPWRYEPPESEYEDGVILGPGDVFVAETSYDGLSNTKEHDELADGRLIALAPEMAELLEKMRNAINALDMLDGEHPLVRDANDLLKRARGEG